MMSHVRYLLHFYSLKHIMSGAPPAQHTRPGKLRPTINGGVMPRSILQNQGKTAVLLVLPPIVSLTSLVIVSQLKKGNYCLEQFICISLVPVLKCPMLDASVGP